MTAVQSRVGHAAATAQTIQPVESPAVWLGSDLAKTDEWMYRLSEEEIGELEAALRQTQERGLAIIDIGREDFPLPTLGPVLVKLQEQVVNGRGFVLIKRIPVERYTEVEAQTIYWGMGHYWGDAVSQNGKGHVLGHVKDLGMAEGDPARLSDDLEAPLSHRFVRHRLPHVPGQGQVRGPQQHCQFGRHPQRDPAPPARPDRDLARAFLHGPQVRAARRPTALRLGPGIQL